MAHMRIAMGHVHLISRPSIRILPAFMLRLVGLPPGHVTAPATTNASREQVRLTGDEVLALISRRGFEICEQRTQPCAYTTDTQSMFRPSFLCIFFVARKGN